MLEQDAEITIFDLAKDKLSRTLGHVVTLAAAGALTLGVRAREHSFRS